MYRPPGVMSATIGVRVGDRVELVDRQRDAILVGDRQQVQHAVRRAAGRGDGRRWRCRSPRRSTIEHGRTSWRTRSITSSPAARGLVLAGSSAGMPLRPAGERPRNSMAIAIVLAVNWPPHAPAPGQARVLDLVQLLERDLAGPVRADRLEDVTIVGRRGPCTCRGRSSRCRGRAPGTSSRTSAMAAPGMVLSQPTRQTTPSNRWPRDHELDRVGDHLAADERRLHALGAHRDAVGDRDRVELHRRAAGRADALLDRRLASRRWL